MQQTDAIYATLISQPHRVEAKLEVWNKGGTRLVHTFAEEEIASMSTTKALFTDANPTVGGTVSSEIDCELYNDNDVTIPRMAMLRPYVRLVGDTETSSWIPKGIYWVDTRQESASSGKIQIHGYDAMLKGEKLFVSGSLVQDWPRTDKQVLNGFTINGRSHDGIAQKMGVTIQQDTLNLINKGYAVQFPGTVQVEGNNETSVKSAAMTVREVLGAIGAMYCGNWTIDEDGTMRLVLFGEH